MSEEVLIIGAGAAGLSAALALSQAGLAVRILEARDRVGGRIQTIRTKPGGLPVELGAEFIHGERNITWEYIRQSGLQTHCVPDRHWRPKEGQLIAERNFWDELGQVTEKIDPRAPDENVASFLERLPDLKPRTRQLAKDFVEGFHAADPARMGVHAVARAEEASERDEGTHAFRLSKGYSALLDWFGAQLSLAGVRIELNTQVKQVCWTLGKVRVRTRMRAGPAEFRAAQALVTLPLGVLQAPPHEGVSFEPGLREKQSAINSLAMGHVLKLTLHFAGPFWPVDNFGFLHGDGGWFRTWWSDERGPILTGWVGGPKAERLSQEGPEALRAKALSTLGGMFNLEGRALQHSLVGSYNADWGRDPFSRGAYSYTPVDMGDMPALLGKPLDQTLFFAGEATDGTGEQGTVHAALESGRRAAREILAARRF